MRTAISAFFLLCCLLIAGCGPVLGSAPGMARQPTPPPPPTTVPSTTAVPVPTTIPDDVTFQGCPPAGDGSDPDLNRHKNRIDVPAAAGSRAVADLLRLPWPSAIARRPRATWTAADRATVARDEGQAVSVTGYLAGVRLEGPESPNCHRADADGRDDHLWLVATPTSDRRQAIVVESTPRIRIHHPRWTVPNLTQLADRHTPVRITGWTMLDQEHPEQIGKTRGTLWEIHPITQIEIQQAGQWIALDAGF